MAVHRRPPADRAGDRELGKALRLGSVTCICCKRPVGIVWFGKGPELVDPVEVWHEQGDGRSGYALLLHRCDRAARPSAEQAEAATTARTAGAAAGGTSATPRRRGGPAQRSS
jgi:hypothetical protein